MSWTRAASTPCTCKLPDKLPLETLQPMLGTIGKAQETKKMPQFPVRNHPFLKADKKKRSAWRTQVSSNTASLPGADIKKNLGNFSKRWSLQIKTWCHQCENLNVELNSSKDQKKFKFCTGQNKRLTNKARLQEQRRQQTSHPRWPLAVSPRLPCYSSKLDTEMHKKQLRNKPIESKDNLRPPYLPSWGQKLCHWIVTAGLARQMVFSVVLPQRSKPDQHNYRLLSHGLNLFHHQLCPSAGPAHSLAQDL